MAAKRGEPSSASFRKTLSTKSSSLRSLFYSKSNISIERGRSGREGSVGGTIKEEEMLAEDGETLAEANISTHSTMSEMGTSATEAHHTHLQSHSQRPSTALPTNYSERSLQSQRDLQSQSRLEQHSNAHLMQQRQGNVQIQINGRYVPQLDMIFSAKRSNASSSFLLGSTSSNGGDDEPSCRFVNGNGLRPSTQTLQRLVKDSTGESEDSLDQHTEPTCTCHESIRNSPHHLCDQQMKQSDREPVLSYGRNLLRYTLYSTKGEAVASAEAHLYLWSSSDSVIVSDVDGTVTKSNVRGVIDSVLQDNFSYCHAGICKFFRDILDRGDEDECIEEGEEVILENGTIKHQIGRQQSWNRRNGGEIRFLYLSSRPISLIDQTRKLLVSLVQRCPANRAYSLPPGPILCHTGPLSSVLFSELVAKDIHEFKADVLARQVVLPFVASRGEDWKQRRNSAAGCDCGESPRNSTDAKDASERSWSGLSEASSMWDDRLFLAGFGNMLTDAMAYEMAGVDRRDIYIIDRDSRILCMGMDQESERSSSVTRGMSESTNTSSMSAANNPCAVGCDQEEWPLTDTCCSGQRDSPGTVRFTPSTKDKSVAPTIASVELSITEGGQQQEVLECVSGSQISVGDRRDVMKTQSKSSRMQSIRAFSSKKSFSTKFPSFRSVSSGGSKPPRKLYDGYNDPLLLARVRERMIGWNGSMY
ncbi:hypothetical protein ACHAXT_001205 [Thalassiosira profunda]